jgi:hypothetical protein
MTHKVAGIDVHKKVLMVVVVDASQREENTPRRALPNNFVLRPTIQHCAERVGFRRVVDETSRFQPKCLKRNSKGNWPAQSSVLNC